jgi:hypothetical protein
MAGRVEWEMVEDKNVRPACKRGEIVRTFWYPHQIHSDLSGKRWTIYKIKRETRVFRSP